MKNPVIKTLLLFALAQRLAGLARDRCLCKENGMKSTTLTLIAGLFLAPQFPALAADHNHNDHNGHAMPAGQSMPAGQAMGMAWAEGTVKKINADVGKVTINHGPLTNLDMPAMTMVFRVKDPIWLSQIKPGDRIRFVAERQDGALTITALQPDR